MAAPPPPGVTPSPISTGQPTTPATPAAGQPSAAVSSVEIELMVTGGEFDGSYRAQAESVCDYRPAEGTFSVAYADDSAQDGFVALDLVLRDTDAAQEDESSDFLAELNLDGPGTPTSVTLDPVAQQGDGAAFLDISEFDATVELSGDTADGALVDLTLICDFGEP